MSHPGKKIFKALNASLNDAADGMEVTFHFQFCPESEVRIGEPKILQHVYLDAETKKYMEVDSSRNQNSAGKEPDRFIDERQTGDERTADTIKTFDLFPPAEYIRLPDVERRKQEIFCGEYIDLTGTELNLKDIRRQLRHILPQVRKSQSSQFEVLVEHTPL